MVVDRVQALEAALQAIQARLTILEQAAKPLVDQLTPPILQEGPAWPKKTPKSQ